MMAEINENKLLCLLEELRDFRRMAKDLGYKLEIRVNATKFGFEKLREIKEKVG